VRTERQTKENPAVVARVVVVAVRADNLQLFYAAPFLLFLVLRYASSFPAEETNAKDLGSSTDEGGVSSSKLEERRGNL
jgi:hypothetical protein